jgi:membrane-associated phospholipid phosphatase
MKRFLYAVFFFLIFSLSAVILSQFTDSWGRGFFGSPLASQELSSGKFLIKGLLLDLLVWFLVAILASSILLRFWSWERKLQVLSLLLFFPLILTLYNFDLADGFFQAGWPMKAISEGEVFPLAIIVNTLIAFLVAGVFYFFSLALRSGKACLPGLWGQGALFLALAIAFAALALFLPQTSGLSFERFVLEKTTLEPGFWRDLSLVLTDMNTAAVSLFLSMIALLALRDRDWRLAFMPLLASLFFLFGIDEIKGVVERLRPPGADVSGLALPAGHPAAGMTYFVLALLTWRSKYFPYLLSLGIFLALLSGVLRLLLGYHWLGDLFAGWVWGALMYSLAALLLTLLSHLFFALGFKKQDLRDAKGSNNQ